MILKAQQGLSAHLQGTSNLWPLAQPRWKDSVRCSTEGGDGTNQERCRATDTIDTSLSTPSEMEAQQAGMSSMGNGRLSALPFRRQVLTSQAPGAASYQGNGNWSAGFVKV